MAKSPVESRKYLSHTLAEWACALNYEHLSPAAIEKAKLFWFDSLGCGLGGSQQEDSHILLAHYKAMGGSGPCTVGMRAICTTIPSGSALRLSLQASSFPAFSVNPGTGADASETRLFDCRIVTLRFTAGRLLLPVERTP